MKRSARQKQNQTFDDIRRSVQVQTLSEKDRRILSFLKEGNTQSQISQKLRVPKSTVSVIVKKLEEAGLIRKRWETRFNILYDCASEVESILKKVDVPTPKITTMRVHNVRRKRKILSISSELSTDKRARWEFSWTMRSKKDIRHSYSFLGKTGEPSVTLQIHHKTIVGFLDAKQYVIAETVEAAEDKARQYIDQAIEKFVRIQNGFGIRIEVEGVSQPISQIHYGGAGRKDHPAVQEVLAGKVKDWFGDQSYDELNIHDVTEVETVVRKNALRFEKAMDLPYTLPSLIRDALDPLHQSMDSVSAHMQAMTTPQLKINEQTQMILHLMEENRDLRNRIEQLEGK